MNETLNSIYRRRSIRTYTDQPVSDEDVVQVLEAANQAPSAHNQQSWRFVVVRGEKKDALARLVADGADTVSRRAAALMRMAARSILSAPVVIAVANTGDLIAHGTELFEMERSDSTDFFRTMEIQNSAAAVENLMLAATSLGLATVWLGVLYLIKDDVLEFLGERKGEFMAVIPLGYAARESKGPKKVPVEQVIRHLS